LHIWYATENLLAHFVDNKKYKREDQAYHNTGHDREIERKMAAFNLDVAWQLAQVWDLVRKLDDQSGYNQNYSA
jgi:hypothetical protein